MATLPKSLPHRSAPSPKAVSKSPSSRIASIAEAKASLSALVNSVESNRAEVTLLRRGVPVAMIVPIRDTKPVSGYGWMRGSARELGDIVGPTGEEWTSGNA